MSWFYVHFLPQKEQMNRAQILDSNHSIGMPFPEDLAWRLMQRSSVAQVFAVLFSRNWVAFKIQVVSCLLNEHSAFLSANRPDPSCSWSQRCSHAMNNASTKIQSDRFAERQSH